MNCEKHTTDVKPLCPICMTECNKTTNISVISDSLFSVFYCSSYKYFQMYTTVQKCTYTAGSPVKDHLFQDHLWFKTSFRQTLFGKFWSSLDCILTVSHSTTARNLLILDILANWLMKQTEPYSSKFSHDKTKNVYDHSCQLFSEI